MSTEYKTAFHLIPKIQNCDCYGCKETYLIAQDKSKQFYEDKIRELIYSIEGITDIEEEKCSLHAYVFRIEKIKEIMAEKFYTRFIEKDESMLCN